MTSPRVLSCADKQLDLQYPQVMGVLNITPDSFSDGGNLYDDAKIPVDKIIANAQRMIDEGASVLDIGGCLLYTSLSPRDKRQSRMPSSA